MIFPGNVAIRATGRSQQATLEPPDWGVYADNCWNGWPGRVLDWADYGVPRDDEDAIAVILEAVARARSGQDILIGCRGGIGRTGTILAAVAVVTGVPAGRALHWVRARYDSRAVETDQQRKWVEARFASDSRVRREAQKRRNQWIDRRRQELSTAMAEALHAADPLPRLEWAIPQRFAIAQRPLRAHPEYGGSRKDYPAAARAAIDEWIVDLQRQGIRSVIALISNTELGHYDAPTGDVGGLLALYEANDLHVRHFPADDPAHDLTAEGAFKEAVDRVASEVAEALRGLPMPAAMHCSAAIDRSPPVAARVAWLAEAGCL